MSNPLVELHQLSVQTPQFLLVAAIFAEAKRFRRRRFGFLHFTMRFVGHCIAPSGLIGTMAGRIYELCAHESLAAPDTLPKTKYVGHLCYLQPRSPRRLV